MGRKSLCLESVVSGPARPALFWGCQVPQVAIDSVTVRSAQSGPAPCEVWNLESVLNIRKVLDTNPFRRLLRF